MARSLFGKTASRWLRRFTPLQWLSWGLEAACLWSLGALLGGLPLPQARRLGGTLLAHLGPRLAKHAFVRDHLRRVVPTASPAQQAQLARDHWRQVGQVLAEYPHLEALAATVPLEIHPATAALIAARQPMVFVGAHLGNWELPPLLAARAGVALCAVYAPLQNPLADRWLQRMRRRSATAPQFLPKSRGLRGLLQALKQGQSLGLLVDQRPDQGELVPFFGEPAPTWITPAWLAVKYGVPLVPLRCVRDGSLNLRVELHAPLALPPTDLDADARIAQLTEEINERLADWIRDHPPQWLCVKRRWPKPGSEAAADAPEA